MTKTKLTGETALERAVARWANSCGADYDDGAAGSIAGLMQGGCQSGIVSELIYYHDTLKFYAKHKKEISALLRETMDSLGVDGPAGVFGDKWEKEDPLADDTQNQNLLAWFAFEETARNLAGRAGIEL